MATVHMQLDFPVRKRPLRPFNSTKCSAKGPQRAPKNPRICAHWPPTAPNQPGLNIGTELVGKGTSPSRHFVTLDGPKSLTMGSKRAHFTCLCTPNGLVIILEKRVFDPFLTLFGPQKAHFQGFLELWSVITGHHGLKTG